MPQTKLTLPDHLREHIDSKIAQINARISTLDSGDAFVYITDLHIEANSGNSFALIDEIVRRTEVKKVFYNGDTASAYGTREQCIFEGMKAKSLFGMISSDAKVYMARGNHDFTIRSAPDSDSGYTVPRGLTCELITSAQRGYTICEPDKCYYYFDNPEQKLRYIVLDTADGVEASENSYWGVAYGIRQEQITWLIKTVESTPESFELIVFGHIPLIPELKSHDESVASASALLEALQNRRVFDYSRKIPEINVDISAKADFTARTNRVVGVFSGHNHLDSSAVRDGILHITTCCDAFYRDDPNNSVRTRKTPLEQCFDVVIYDRDANTLETIRIGAGSDRRFELPN